MRITDAVIDEMNEWCSRPPLPVYAAVFIGAIQVLDGQVANRAFNAALGVDLEGHRDVLRDLGGSDGRGKSAKYWMGVLTEIKNCGVQNNFFIVCDGLKGLPHSANAVFPLATIRTCTIHCGHPPMSSAGTLRVWFRPPSAWSSLGLSVAADRLVPQRSSSGLTRSPVGGMSWSDRGSRQHEEREY